MKNILSLSARAACLLLFAGATACTSSDGSTDPGESADELSSSAPAFVTLRPDPRTCGAPLCGGYFVRAVNRPRIEHYVSGLDLAESGLPADALEDIRSAPLNELVLSGHLGALDQRYRTRKFVVQDAYRGMPGVTPREGAAFYQVHARNPPILCLVAPCPNEIASLLNTGTEEAFDRISVNPAALSWVDKGWLGSRVEKHDAVVAGMFVQGDRFPGGYEHVLEASQVFVRLPDRIGPCPERPAMLCSPGASAVYQRTVDRCIEQVGCVPPKVCMQYIPECQPGYTLMSWAALPDGCPSYACDPSFIVE